MAVTRWMSDYFEQAFLDYVFNDVNFQPDWWHALFYNGTTINARTGAASGGVEIVGNNYARQQVTDWELAVNTFGTHPNTHIATLVRTDAPITYPEPSANWGSGPIGAGAWYDASSGGNFLAAGTPSPATIADNITPQPGKQLVIPSAFFPVGLHQQRNQSTPFEYKFFQAALEDIFGHIFGITTRTNVLEFSIWTLLAPFTTWTEPTTDYARISVPPVMSAVAYDGTYYYVENTSEVRFGPVTTSNWGTSGVIAIMNGSSFVTDQFIWSSTTAAGGLYAVSSYTNGDYVVIPAGNLKFRLFA